jgi:hypothetical protein
VGLALELEDKDTLLAEAEGVFMLVTFWFGGGFGGLILRLGTVGMDAGVEALGTTFIVAGDCAGETFWLLGVVFVCILMLLVRVLTVERV